MKQYDPQVLRRVQLVELSILKDFDALCQKHNIPYVVMFGAAIGAVRHGGFIPWDDDVDIVMLREDCERFIKISKEECSEKYQIVRAEEDINFPFISTLWGLKGTKFVKKGLKLSKGDAPISIDIFPFDNVSDDENQMKKQRRAVLFWSRLMLLRQTPFPEIGAFHGNLTKIVQAICIPAHFGMKLLHISPKWLYKKCKEEALKYQNESTERVAYLPLNGLYPSSLFTREELFPPRYLEFEGVSLPFPNQLEKVLTRIYGDYMQLPPESERRNHYPYILDFGEGNVAEQ